MACSFWLDGFPGAVVCGGFGPEALVFVEGYDLAADFLGVSGLDLRDLNDYDLLPPNMSSCFTKFCECAGADLRCTAFLTA